MYCEEKKINGGTEGGRQGQDDTENIEVFIIWNVGELQNSQGLSKSFALPTSLAAT